MVKMTSGLSLETVADLKLLESCLAKGDQSTAQMKVGWEKMGDLQHDKGYSGILAPLFHNPSWQPLTESLAERVADADHGIQEAASAVNRLMENMCSLTYRQADKQELYLRFNSLLVDIKAAASTNKSLNQPIARIMACMATMSESGSAKLTEMLQERTQADVF